MYWVDKEINQDKMCRNKNIILKNIDKFVFKMIDAYDINLREMRMENQIMIPEGEFVYYNGREFQTAEDNSQLLCIRNLISS